MRIFRAFLLLIGLSTSLLGQGSGDVFARARRMVNEGNARAGRALVDSMLAVAPANSPAFAEALYWRGVLAEDGDSARTDLLRLAQAEFTRGDRETALRHLDQLAREHPDAPSRAAGRYWTARILFEDAKPAEACAALRDARQLAASSDVELVNQIEYYARPCGSSEDEAKRLADGRARADSAVKADSVAKADAAAKAMARKATDARRPSAKGKWSVQVAAYGGDRDAADALVKRLKTRGFDARVTDNKPWRVRVGHYPTRADAADVAQRLSSKGSKAMVVEAEGR